MKILVLTPGERPRERDIPEGLKAMQEVVEGSIQAIYPFEEHVALICHEEGKLLNLPPNRALRDPETGAVYDIVCGTCLLCGAPPDKDSFAGLTPEQLSHYQEYYRMPEPFLRTDSGLLILKGV